MTTKIHCAGIAVLLGIVSAGCSATVPGSDASDDSFLGTENGLNSVNGLSIANGLMIANGLTTSNGLTIANGKPLVNGLSSANGMPVMNGLGMVNGITIANGIHMVNGITVANGITIANGVPVDFNRDLPVDCGATGVVGVDCWGFADGLLSHTTGMMSSAAGVTTAQYMVRCALPKGQTLGLVAYDGEVVRMPGEAGLAPEWKDGLCDDACQENITACLMALTNGRGNHVAIEMSSTKNALGGGHSSAYPHQEAVFFGNMFQSPPIARFCVGKSYAPKSWPGTNPGLFLTYSPAVSGRACGAYADGACPYVEEALCNQATGWWPPPPPATCNFTQQTEVCTKNWWGGTTCSMKSTTIDTATSCKSSGSGARTWNYPITTYRKDVTAK